MARNIPVDSLNKIAQTKGLEPINIIRVQWASNGGYHWYADRSIDDAPHIEGKLLSLDNLEAVLNINNSGTSTSVKVSLDDIDGSIKSIFNTNDIHGRPVAIFQWFSDLPLNAMFLVFSGNIASPIEWSEGSRTLTFDVMTRIEDIQAGFTVEDGEFVNIPRIMVGKAWPLIFGTVLDVPALQMDEMPSGTTRIDIGIPDEHVESQAIYHNANGSELASKAACLDLRGAELMFAGQFQGGGKDMYARGEALKRQARDMIKQSNAQSFQGNRLGKILQDQRAYDVDVIPIINGRLFLQNTEITININGAMYSGKFVGDNFTVSSRIAPEEATPKKPKSSQADSESAIPNTVIQDTQEYTDSVVANMLFGGAESLLQQITELPADTDAYWSCDPPYFYAISNVTANDRGKTVGEHKLGKFFFAQAGSGVSVGTNYPIRYVLSIVPGTQVLWLSAKRTVNQLKQITPIPTDYYTISTLDLGGVVATIATFSQPLSTRKTVDNDLDWGDDVYATLTSPIGPNVVDEMIYIIQRWTSYGIDYSSFNYVRAKVDLYPANFALLDKKNVTELLQEMAFQSRCAIWLADNVWHIRYLPEQGTPVDTIIEKDLEQQTLVIGTTATEDLTTRYIATWKQSYGADAENKLILQYNILKYGVHEETYNYYIYNVEELVFKSAIFWLIRKGNVWKTLKCKAFLSKLKIETLDNVNVNLANEFSHYGNVVGSVTKAAFNSGEFAIDLEIWLPVRLGEMVPYDFAYPAGVSAEKVWPTEQDIPGSFTQSSYQPDQATGNLGGNNNNNIPPKKPLKEAEKEKEEEKVRPSDARELIEPPPVISETVDETSPNYISNPGTPQEGDHRGPTSGRSRPRYDHVNRSVAQPRVTPERPLPPRVYPGQILSKISAGVYSGVIYPRGLGDGGTAVPHVVILDIDPNETIPSGTWGTIIFQTEYGSGGEPISRYYFQPQIWY
jgi:hypothetical protein